MFCKAVFPFCETTGISGIIVRVSMIRFSYRQIAFYLAGVSAEVGDCPLFYYVAAYAMRALQHVSSQWRTDK